MLMFGFRSTLVLVLEAKHKHCKVYGLQQRPVELGRDLLGEALQHRDCPEVADWTPLVCSTHWPVNLVHLAGTGYLVRS